MRTCLLIVILALTGAGGSAHAFDLGYHDDFTRRGLHDAGFSDDAIEMIGAMNIFADLAVQNVVARQQWLKDLHFDDRFSFSRHKALHDRLDAWVAGLNRFSCRTTDDIYVFAATMGVLLHGYQDYYAHSNHVELLAKYKLPEGTFYDVLTNPVYATLATVWAADASSHVAEALMSGAYFSGATPDLDDTEGDPRQLTHAALHKDSPSVGGAGYLYPKECRGCMHHAAGRVASKETTDVARKFERANPSCVSRIKGYKFGLLERPWMGIKRATMASLGNVFGHWRSGNAVTIGDGVRVDHRLPTTYPDANVPRTFRYEITNTLDRPLRELRFSSTDDLAVADPISPPPGWTVARRGDDVVFTAATPLAANATVVIELLPAPTAVWGLGRIQTEANRVVEIAAPVVPGHLDAFVIRAGALLEGGDANALMDAAGIPPSKRTTPNFDLPTPGRVNVVRHGCACGTTTPAGSSTLVTLAVVFALRRRRSR